MVPLLRARAYAAGINLQLMVGDHNVIATQLIDPRSALHAFAADVVIVAALTRDLAPALWTAEGNLGEAGGGGQPADRRMDRRLSKTQHRDHHRAVPGAAGLRQRRDRRCDGRRRSAAGDPRRQRVDRGRRRRPPRRLPARLRRAGRATRPAGVGGSAQRSRDAGPAAAGCVRGAGRRIPAVPVSARGQDLQGAGGRSRQHPVGRHHRRRWSDRDSHRRGLPGLGVSRAAAAAEGPAPARRAAGDLQQEQRRRRDGGAARSSRDAVAAG